MQRALEVWDRCGIKGTVIVCAVLAERYPAVLRAVVEAGHDIVAHSYGMDVIPAYLDVDAERENIRRTTRLPPSVNQTFPAASTVMPM